MPPPRWRALQMAHGLLGRRACRVVAGARRPIRYRSFHHTAIANQTPDDRTGPSKGENGTSQPPENEEAPKSSETASTVANGPAIETKDEAQKSPRREVYGSSIRRAARKKRTTEIPPLQLPSWFLEKNVKLSGQEPKIKQKDLRLIGRLAVMPPKPDAETKLELGLPVFDYPAYIDTKTLGRDLTSLAVTCQWVLNRIKVDDADTSSDSKQALEKLQKALEKLQDFEYGAEAVAGNPLPQELLGLSKYHLNSDPPPSTLSSYAMFYPVFSEIATSLRAIMAVKPPSIVDSNEILRPDTLLYCPLTTGSGFLDAVVERLADVVHVDLLEVDADDITEIISEYLGESMAWTAGNTSSLSFSVLDSGDKMERFGSQEDRKEKDEDDDEVPRRSIASIFPVSQNGNGDIRLPHFELAPKAVKWLQNSLTQVSAAEKSDFITDSKITAAIEALIDSAKSKRQAESKGLPQLQIATDIFEAEASQSHIPINGPNGTIIHIKGYREIMASENGEKIIEKIQKAVYKRWQSGEKIIIVGSTCLPASDEAKPSSGKDVFEAQSDAEDGLTNTYIVTPAFATEENLAYFHERESERLRAINQRHLTTMVKSLLSGTDIKIPEKVLQEAVSKEGPSFIQDLQSATEMYAWSYARTYRVALAIVGGLLSSRAPTTDALVNASINVRRSDFLKSQVVRELSKMNGLDYARQPFTQTSNAWEDKLKNIKSKCDKYESKLLAGVIKPASLHTKFNDVHAPATTIEALKTLTSLSFERPDEFTYGVLAKDKIPGVLLYGPPGTGKTLLAKALAKESAVTMLEVSGADLNDKYVGEGEKNVKALFSLANKLSPCVVFLDEADAILGARSSGSGRRASHRDIINQFLREWDGMTNLSAFIIVATNRPFDLDEAVLRRLPRRLLIDLPSEPQREAILKIHLQDELLDESVSLSKIAKETPFYSGSDLKNLSVAAALACLREDLANKPSTSATASSATPDTSTSTPSKRRVLTAAHFNTALQEISASSSDDMQTLDAIRKFDQKYGDRRGRRKKGPGLGFGGTKDPEKDSEAARVRKIT